MSGANNKTGRVFITDFMCAFGFGHNPKSVALFKKAFDSLGFEVICLVPSNFSVGEYKFNNELYYPYSNLITPDNPSIFQYKQINRRLTQISKYLNVQPKVWLAYLSWHRVFKKHEIGPDDLIFFPSADYVGAISLLNFLNKKNKNFPKVHFRFINVLENYKLLNKFPRNELIKSIKNLFNKIDISISTETISYSKYISKILNIKILYFPYPFFDCFTNTPERFIVSSPGAGRADKGFFETYEIAKHLCIADPTAKVTIQVQEIPKSNGYYDADYSEKLREMPNVELLPSRLTDSEIDSVMKSASAYFLPYDASTYSLRGSAIFQEAIMYNRPVITKPGLGFSDLVTRYKAGVVVESPKQFAESILRIYRGEIASDFRADSELYKSDFDSAISEVAFR